MAMRVQALGRVRQILGAIVAEPLGGEEEFALTQQLELLVAAGSAPYREITRVGRAFQIHTSAAIGAVVAVPTTAHMLALYNTENDGGRSYVIDWVAATNVVSTAVASQAQMVGLVGQVREAIPADSGLVPTKMNGNGPGSDTASRTIVNATALPAGTGLAANWFPLGPNSTKPGVAATPGYGMWAPIDGRVIVAPGRYFAVHVLANVVGETFLAYIGWHEAQLALG
jgi:hypothetical protein